MISPLHVHENLIWFWERGRLLACNKERFSARSHTWFCKLDAAILSTRSNWNKAIDCGYPHRADWMSFMAEEEKRWLLARMRAAHRGSVTRIISQVEEVLTSTDVYPCLLHLVYPLFPAWCYATLCRPLPRLWQLASLRPMQLHQSAPSLSVTEVTSWDRLHEANVLNVIAWFRYRLVHSKLS